MIKIENKFDIFMWGIFKKRRYSDWKNSLNYECTKLNSKYKLGY